MTERNITREEIESLWERSIAPGMTIEMSIKPPSDVPEPTPSAAEPVDLSSSLTVADRIEVREQTIADAGKVIPPPQYELLDILGEGGMGTVFRARQTSVDRQIALKMLRPESAEKRRDRDRFLSEAVATADLDHPNIIPVHDLGTNESGQLFYAMKEVRGTPWEEVLDGKPLQENLSILLRVADAVAFAHSRGIIHRDLKPDNVMLGDYGEVMLTDWGLAVSVTEEGKAARLEEGHTVGGTPSYMAPELAAGDIKLIGPCSDVYLLGAILFRVVTGRSPHSGDGVMECLRNAANNVIRLSEEEMIKTRERELLDIALRALATEPGERHGDVKAFQTELRAYLDHAESIALTEHAAADLEKAQQSRDYQDYTEALSGYGQALKLWAENERARTGLKDAQLIYATCAFERGDFDLADSLLVGGVTAHRALAKRIDAARRERDAHVKRVKTFKTVAAVCAAAVLVLGVGAFIWVQRAELNAVQAEKEAKELAAKREAEEAREWHVVFEEDFSGPDIGTGLVITGGTWEVRDGELAIERGTPTRILLRQVPKNQAIRITFDFRLESEYLNDLSCFIGGYQFQYGGFDNTRNGLYGPDITRQESASPLVRSRQYHAVATKSGRRLTYEVNGEMVFDLDVTDQAAVEEGQPEVGLIGWKGDARYDNIRAYVLGPPLKVDLLDVADRQMAKGNHSTAKNLYGEVLDSAQAETRRERARIGYDRAAGHVNLQSTRVAFADLLHGRTNRLSVGRYGLHLDLSHLGLKNLPSLQEIPVRALDCSGNPDLSSLAPLRGLYLKSLSISGTAIADTSALDGPMLRDLDFSVTPITNLPRVVRMHPKLTDIRFRDCNISDLSPLRGLQLELLDCSENLYVSDLAPLQGMPLRELHCGKNRIADLSPLTGMRLNALFCADNAIRDLTPLKGLPLKHLDISGNPVSALSSLAGMPLVYLTFSGCNVEDISPLRGMKNLDVLRFGENRVSDLSPLRDMMMTGLGFRDNLVSDLTPLKGMPLNWLDCTRNRIEDLSPLDRPMAALACGENPIRRLPSSMAATLSWLFCPDTQISDLVTLATNKGLRELDVSGTGIRDLSALTTRRLSSLGIVGLPLTEANAAVIKAQRVETITIELADAAALELIGSIPTLKYVNRHSREHALTLAGDLRRLARGETVNLARYSVRIGGFRWLAVPVLMTPADAVAFCRTHGYRLASPSTPDKETALLAYLRTVCYPHYSFTAGALRERTTGEWRWASGEKVSDQRLHRMNRRLLRKHGGVVMRLMSRSIDLGSTPAWSRLPFVLEWDAEDD